mmetsp:Transcript_19448/g.28090  ORF Transcript_19448/g.28090 Transcript_19448/m.28090 type:complete len:110 (+) Transcript_19448:1034-1363(+)
MVGTNEGVWVGSVSWTFDGFRLDTFDGDADGASIKKIERIGERNVLGSSDGSLLSAALGMYVGVVDTLADPRVDIDCMNGVGAETGERVSAVETPLTENCISNLEEEKL